MDASDFAATVIRRQHELVVELRGELDAASGPMLTTAVATSSTTARGASSCSTSAVSASLTRCSGPGNDSPSAT